MPKYAGYNTEVTELRRKAIASGDQSIRLHEAIIGNDPKLKHAFTPEYADKIIKKEEKEDVKNIPQELLEKKQREGKVGTSKRDAKNFLKRLSQMASAVRRDAGIRKGKALQLIRKLDLMDSITQGQIDDICKEFRIVFKSKIDERFKPGFAPNPENWGADQPFSFSYYLGAPVID
ncbi:MAG: hypothetical protein WC302_01890 [Candidatus Paceibacterota bacterium]|jgi:hypothetical protein